MTIALMKHKYWLFILLPGLLAGCRQLPGVSTLDLSDQYNVRPDHSLAIQSVPYNTSDSITTLYLRIRRDILEKEYGPEPDIMPRLMYVLHTAYENGTVSDSGHILIPWPPAADGNAWVTLQLDLPVSNGQSRICQLSMGEIPGIRHLSALDRTTAFGRQDVLLTDPAGNPLFDPVIRAGQPFRLAISSQRINELRTDQFSSFPEIALPPFAFRNEPAKDLLPLRSWNILLQDGLSPVIVLENKGLYLFRKDKTSREGFSLLCLDESFPVVNSAEDMLPPLQYLTTSREFADLQAVESPKLAIDRFWLSVTGNAGRARLRIREFYSRIEQANELFTSFQEGWKTDRGIIYVVYGPPKVVYRNDKTEKWIYGEAGNSHSLRFSFSKVETSFTIHEYRLNRSPVYKESWYNAVEAWRR
ncbi:MAG: GWxTD domain-containing protein [Bacteroidales bacterium]|nr:GWxTD domain-containing protein [Bacteroidales bacterium]